VPTPFFLFETRREGPGLPKKEALAVSNMLAAQQAELDGLAVEQKSIVDPENWTTS
jgi:hypothetical protein